MAWYWYLISAILGGFIFLILLSKPTDDQHDANKLIIIGIIVGILICYLIGINPSV